jgi:nicotinate (nicotinamide) nucleotide adenylyltransferase
MKQIGLFFGSFNPVHQGHLILANYLVEETALEEVWFVITPQSPFKQKQRLLDNHHRLAMVEEAIEDYPKLKSSTVEFGLPAPQYTALSVAHLKEKHPEASIFPHYGSGPPKIFSQVVQLRGIASRAQDLCVSENARRATRQKATQA